MYVARLSSRPILTVLLSRLDEPLTRCELACVSANGLAIGHRGEQVDTQDLGRSSAVTLVGG